MKNNNQVPKIELSGKLSGFKATMALNRIYERVSAAISKGQIIIIASNDISSCHHHILIVES